MGRGAWGSRLFDCGFRILDFGFKGSKKEKGTGYSNAEVGMRNAEFFEIETKKPLAFTKFGDVKEMGRFVLVRGNDVVAGGIIL